MLVERLHAVRLAVGFALALGWNGLCSEREQVRAEESLGTPAVRFNRDVRPILSDQCFACHGFDSKKRAADLRLDTPEGAFEKRANQSVIVPGDPSASLVWQRILSEDPDERMPPANSHKTLSSEQKEILRRWIEQGATYEKHWAFEAPSKSDVPDASVHLIDGWIRDRLKREALSPTARADRATLLRRLSFALTGLPPSQQEMDAYFSDSSEQAYETMVDRYLQSSHYGEEQARYWLDVARYADTHGLHLDNEREMWAYRDWVIRAFNQNVPFDQFTVWQIAGDLLPEPTNDQWIATGFNRCNVTTSEGGALDDEFRYRYAVDRASTVMETWLGLTGGCAVCHDHKYDPLTTREFYSFYAFFNSAADPPMDKNIATTEPFVKIYSLEQKQTVQTLRDREAEALKQLRESAAKLTYTEPSSADDARAIVEDTFFDDLFPLGAAVKNTTRNPSVWVTSEKQPIQHGKRALYQASSSFIDEDITLTTTPYVLPKDAAIEVWIYPDPHSPPHVVSLAINVPASKRVYWGKENLEEYDMPRGGGSLYRGPLPTPGQWHRLTVTAEELGLKAEQTVKGFSLQQSGGVVLWDRLTISGESLASKDPRSSFDTWWKSAGGKPLPEVPEELQAVLKLGPDKGADAEKRSGLIAFYLAHVARPLSPELAELRSAWETARVSREAADEAIEGTFVYRDLPKPRESFILTRGQYDKPGERVEPGVPAFLPPLSRGEVLTSGDATESKGLASRLDLANWLVARENPLTARVTVNRLWQQIFGVGLVSTSHDFGSQGTPPTHPELLDALSLHFIESGWDVKALIKLMVTSETFQQSSVITEESHQLDPSNQWLGRGPRFRLDAEQIRDNALFVSGLMNPAMGGRGVKPYQPGNIWEPVGYQNSNTRFYLQDHGADLYRRSVYCFLKRTAPPPFMSNFDAPNREQFCTRRERSNTPLQALQLLNDVQHIEAARALAERILRDTSVLDDERLKRMFKTVLSRHPDDKEMALLTKALAEQRAYYASRLKEAESVINQGESPVHGVASVRETAAWTLIANLILNLDETLTRN